MSFGHVHRVFSPPMCLSLMGITKCSSWLSLSMPLMFLSPFVRLPRFAASFCKAPSDLRSKSAAAGGVGQGQAWGWGCTGQEAPEHRVWQQVEPSAKSKTSNTAGCVSRAPDLLHPSSLPFPGILQAAKNRRVGGEQEVCVWQGSVGRRGSGGQPQAGRHRWQRQCVAKSAIRVLAPTHPGG